MVEITRQHMAMDIAMFVGQLSSKNYADPLIEYQDNADWTDFKIG
jgi:hypothetical protein